MPNKLSTYLIKEDLRFAKYMFNFGKLQEVALQRLSIHINFSQLIL